MRARSTMTSPHLLSLVTGKRAGMFPAQRPGQRAFEGRAHRGIETMGSMVQANRAHLAGLLPVGHRLDGRYEVVRFLGAGGMGLVSAARSMFAECDVAVKVMKERRIPDPRMARRF